MAAGCDRGCQGATTGNPPSEEPESSSCGRSHWPSSGAAEGGAQPAAHSGWVSVGSCRSRTSRTRTWRRRRSRDLVPGSEPGEFGPESMAPLGAGREGSGSKEPRDGGAAETTARSEGSSATAHRADDPDPQSEGWSSWPLRFL